MKSKLIYAGASIALLLTTALLTYRMVNAKQQPRMDSSMVNEMFVKANQVQLVETANDMVYRGRVNAFDNVSLASEVSGILLEGDVHFREGERFNKGDVLLRIYSADVEATLKSGKSSFLQTISAILPDLKVDYPNEYDKWNDFFNAIDVEQPLPELPHANSNKEKVFLATNNVLASYYSLRQQEINLTRYTIRAPFYGSFTAVNKQIGSVASTGVALATLVRLDKIEVTVPVFPSDLKWIKKGDQVVLHNDQGQNQSATVARIADYVDETTQSVNVFLTFETKKGNALLIGSYVDATFKGVSLTGFEIPREALIDETHVYELKENKLHKLKVEVLRQLDDSFIISGIDENTIVVTESLAGVSSNVIYKAR